MSDRCFECGNMELVCGECAPSLADNPETLERVAIVLDLHEKASRLVTKRRPLAGGDRLDWARRIIRAAEAEGV